MSMGSFHTSIIFLILRVMKFLSLREISVEKHADRTSYVGISDNVNLGVSLAFYLLNMVDYVDHVHKVRA